MHRRSSLIGPFQACGQIKGLSYFIDTPREKEMRKRKRHPKLTCLPFQALQLLHSVTKKKEAGSSNDQKAFDSRAEARR